MLPGIPGGGTFPQNNPFPINNGEFVCGVVFSRKILLPGDSSVGVEMKFPSDVGATKATGASSHGARELELIIYLIINLKKLGVQDY